MSSAAKTSFSTENQRAIVKFLFLNDNSAAAIHRQLVKTLGREAFSESYLRRLIRKFKAGDFDIEDHRGGDSTSDAATEERIAQICEAFDQTRAWSLTSLSAAIGIPRSTCHQIIRGKLKMTKKLKKWVPHELSPAQLEMRVVYSASNLRTFHQQKSRLEYTVAVDETWVSLNRPPERDQAREWLRSDEPSGSVALLNRFGPKVMLAMAMDIRGICYYEILVKGERMDAPRYLEFLKRLVDSVGGNRKHLLWLLDDNAKPHRTASITTWLEENKISRRLQSAYSPDLSPCDFLCFHPLKRAIGGVAYPTVDALREAIDREIAHGNAIDKYSAVRRLPERWERCVNNKGEYL